MKDTGRSGHKGCCYSISICSTIVRNIELVFATNLIEAGLRRLFAVISINYVYKKKATGISLHLCINFLVRTKSILSKVSKL